MGTVEDFRLRSWHEMGTVEDFASCAWNESGTVDDSKRMWKLIGTMDDFLSTRWRETKAVTNLETATNPYAKRTTYCRRLSTPACAAQPLLSFARVGRLSRNARLRTVLFHAMDKTPVKKRAVLNAQKETVSRRAFLDNLWEW